MSCEKIVRKVLLNPDDPGRLAAFYKTAATKSTDLLIATAFLTEWPINAKLNKGCNNFLILVGTDFGLTRKNALHKLLKWIPPDKKSNALAVPRFTEGSFHPKIVAWRDADAKNYALIGSSNLTSAAFATNYEANICQEISNKEFAAIRQWLRTIAANGQVITSDWIKSYKESNRAGFGGGKQRKSSGDHVIDLEIKVLKKHHKWVLKRRAQQDSFREIKRRISNLTERGAKGVLSNSVFWTEFWNLWANHHSRFQGSGFQISGKRANWREACTSLLRITNGPSDIFDLDNLVQVEIDYLSKKNNPVRGAWFSEMLCHFFPMQYPLHNKPVKQWLRMKKWRAQRGSTEGSKYVELARKLRITMKHNKEIKSLAELDCVIWQIVHDHNNQQR